MVVWLILRSFLGIGLVVSIGLVVFVHEAFLWCYLGIGLVVGITLVVVVHEAFLWSFLGIGLVVGVHDVVTAVRVWSCMRSGQLSDRHRIWQTASLAALALRKHRRSDWQKSWPDAQLVLALAGARSWRRDW
jgi:hypothetical protein